MRSQQPIRAWEGSQTWVTMQVRSRERRRWASWTKWAVRGQKMDKSIHRDWRGCPARMKERRVKRAMNTWAMWRLQSRFHRRSYRSKSKSKKWSQISRDNRTADLNLGISMAVSLYYQNLEAVRGKSQRKVLLQVKKTGRIRALTSRVRRSWLPLLQRKRTLLLIIWSPRQGFYRVLENQETQTIAKMTFCKRDRVVCRRWRLKKDFRHLAKNNKATETGSEQSFRSTHSRLSP